MTRCMLIAVMAVGLCLAGVQAVAQTHTGVVTITGQAIQLQSDKDANSFDGNFQVGGTNTQQFFWSASAGKWQFSTDLKVIGNFQASSVNLGPTSNSASTSFFLIFGNLGGTRQILKWDNVDDRFEFDAGLQVAGTAQVQILEITGGADFAEDFAINSDTKVEPGSVVSIDATKPGELKLSGKAYDRTVAGIVSGAGGLNTGMRMGQVGSIANGDHPVALSGRVYCKVDATLAAIEPGDLLTTSNMPGHAMKVLDHSLAMGAIIGKAMTPLAQGETGLVLVLVSLQ